MQELESVEHFQEEFIECVDYNNIRRIKAADRACRLHYTGSKLYRLLENFKLEIIVWLLGLFQKKSPGFRM